MTGGLEARGLLRRALLVRAVLAAAASAAITASAASAAEEPGPLRASVRVDASRTLGPVRPIWRFFGADEPNYATMPNGRKLLSRLGALRPKEVYFRTHNLLTSGDGTPALKWGSTGVYDEDAEGRPIYDWRILDGIFDAYLQSGVRPYVQIGFMPKALSRKPEPYQHRWRPGARYEEIYTGWAHPPKDFAKWAELVHQWTLHALERHGKEEVETWWWQTWNEPNIGYWQGTPEEFLELHDHAVDAVRRALPTARVGGPDTAGSGGRFMRRFLEHCLRGKNHATGEVGTPLDFVSFHAKGAPTHVEGHVRMGIREHLRTIDDGFRIIASYPELEGKPIVIGESDPECCAACQGPQLAYRNGTMYSSYTAASFARKLELAERHRVNLEGALTWAFEFEDQPLFAGFRSLATGGIDKPVLNAFRMLEALRGERVEAASDRQAALDAILEGGVRGDPDVGAAAALDGRTLRVLVWHYHDDDVPGPDARVSLSISGLPAAEGEARLSELRVDRDHGNAFTAWLAMGSPQSPTEEERARLSEASWLAPLPGPSTARIEGSGVTLQILLPRQGLSLITLECPASERKVGAVTPAEREALRLDPFYEKSASVGRLPILSSAKVSDEGILEAVRLVGSMLEGRGDILDALADRDVRIVVMAPDEMTTDVPEQRDMKPREYWNRRARGLGGRITSCGEENLLGLPGDRYRGESILIHEFGHAIHEIGLDKVDPGFDARLRDAHRKARDEGLWKGTYADTNQKEYWAEGVQSYFDSNAPPGGVHNEVNTREELKAHDPRLFALLEEVFRGSAFRWTNPAR